MNDFPRNGWVRSDGSDGEELLRKLVETQTELSIAREKLREFEIHRTTAASSAELKVNVDLTIKTYERDYNSSVVKGADVQVTCNLQELFSVLGPNIFEPCNQDKVSNILAVSATRGIQLRNPVAYKFELERESLNTVRLQLEAAGLIKVEYFKTMGGSMANFWTVTDLGKAETLALRTIKN
ncbi:hypothetical protein [Roseovarius rhodophyticola]|uniref:Uncharacterized protein n=1 Tax=Roseovarius rhodophyticola TaxID=3080827 RepID=A0ABZ2TDA8_9RHOB|nr:hypothetical protein [Roseovarius sp. W115]MDV2930955.1 hypothetical protein [Roseovarius sp. W115]